METYIDGFIFPLARKHLTEYARVAQEVANIWKEHGALTYREYVSDDSVMDGTRSFAELTRVEEGETIVFGLTSFQSKEARDRAHERVTADPRMADLLAPLIDQERMIFNAERMVFGGFRALVQ